MILDYLSSKRISSGDLVVVSPDVGGVARARAFAKKLNDAPLAIVDKRRSAHNVRAHLGCGALGLRRRGGCCSAVAGAVRFEGRSHVAVDAPQGTLLSPRLAGVDQFLASRLPCPQPLPSPCLSPGTCAGAALPHPLPCRRCVVARYSPCTLVRHCCR